jgi:two-component system alkaline phosphatase synthesis response regulator PhoP/two-component system response regulator VicR
VSQSEEQKPQPHVLVCDDERHIVRLMQVNLERQGWSVTTASSGEEALAKMRADRPDLLILDSEMPGMSGKEVVRAMREDPALAGIKVILLKGKDDEDDWPDDTPPPSLTINKPFDPRKLFELVDNFPARAP